MDENIYQSSTNLASKAHAFGLDKISSHVWELCCKKHGSGGTPKANEMYTKIMDFIIDEYQREDKEKEEAQARFDMFWKQYPRKQAKPAALRAWKKIRLTPMLFSKILDSLERYKKTEGWLKNKGQFIPMPATWLNQERYNDEIEVEVKDERCSKFDKFN